MILFLDFDGVLHTDEVFVADCDQAEIELLTDHARLFLTDDNKLVSGTNLFVHAERLAGVLDKFPDVQIVISSTWKLYFSMEQLLKFLPPLLAKRVVGQTPSIYMHEWGGWFQREREISEYLKKYSKGEGSVSWIVLDDKQLSSFFSFDFPSNLFRCASDKGFDEKAASEFVEFLQKYECRAEGDEN
jgi:hypothetical protein